MARSLNRGGVRDHRRRPTTPLDPPHPHWRDSPPEQAEQAITTDAFAPLCAALCRAEAPGADLEQLLPHLLNARSLDDTGDLASALQHRLDNTARCPAQQGLHKHAPRVIAGLIPDVAGPRTEDMHTALANASSSSSNAHSTWSAPPSPTATP